MKQVRLSHSLIVLGVLAAAMLVGVVVLGVEPHLPLVISCIFAGCVARFCLGVKWDAILGHMIDGVGVSMEAILTLLCIGMMMASWLASGTVPAMIYYGLQMITARAFLVTTFLVCAAVSLVAGSWGTAGTLGLAFAAIGSVMGVPAAVTAGAVVSGAYVGDKMSPVSDSTTFTASVSGCNIVEGIQKMLPLAIAACAVSAGLFIMTGSRYGNSGADVSGSIEPILHTIKGNYTVNALCFLPVAVVIICIALKIPAMVSILAGAAAGGVLAFSLQGVSLAELLNFCLAGYIPNTDSELINTLLASGGINSMMNTVSIILIAMAFGGLIRGAGLLDPIITPIIRRLRTLFGLGAVTMCFCVLCNAVLPDQYLGIGVPGQLLRPEYEARGIPSTTFFNVLGSGASVTSPLIPWNSCGIYMASLLGATAGQYLRFSYFSLTLPLTMLVYLLWSDLRQKRRP